MFTKGKDVDYRREEDKEAFKEALKEWLDDKFAEFGKWTLKSLSAICFGVVITYLANHHWIK